MRSISDTIERPGKLRSAQGPFVGISSTLHIAPSWGLIASFEKRVNLDPGKSHERPAKTFQPPFSLEKETGIQQTIEKALRAAGLMK